MTHPATQKIRINGDRLWATLMELKEIGAYDDEATALRGVRRLALTDADAEARRRCVRWMTEAGSRSGSTGSATSTPPARDATGPCRAC